MNDIINEISNKIDISPFYDGVDIEWENKDIDQDEMIKKIIGEWENSKTKPLNNNVYYFYKNVKDGEKIYLQGEKVPDHLFHKISEFLERGLLMIKL